MNKLREAREKKGLSQVEIAKKAQIDVRQYQRYEYGEREPRASLVVRLAKILGITVEELFS